MFRLTTALLNHSKENSSKNKMGPLERKIVSIAPVVTKADTEDFKMEVFKIEGGHRLRGELTPQGAKNEALQVLCAVLLTSEEVIIENIPEIKDVLKLIELLHSLGVKTHRIEPGKYSFKAENVDLEYLNSAEFKQQGAALRGSIMIVGPMLARFGKGYIPSPGGDKIGRRRLDVHF